MARRFDAKRVGTTINDLLATSFLPHCAVALFAQKTSCNTQTLWNYGLLNMSIREALPLEIICRASSDLTTMLDHPSSHVVASSPLLYFSLRLTSLPS